MPFNFATSSKPYIQYEEGQFYKTGNIAVASLRLENKGYFDAEDVTIQAAFTEPLTDITSGDAVSPLTVTNGGKGFKYVVGTIPRVVPSQSTYIYFAVDNTSGGVGEGVQSFVKQITFKGGKGSNQPPLWRTILILLLINVVIQVLMSFILGYFKKSKELTSIRNWLDDFNEQGKKRLKESQEQFERDREKFAKQLAEDKARWERELNEKRERDLEEHRKWQEFWDNIEKLPPAEREKALLSQLSKSQDKSSGER